MSRVEAKNCPFCGGSTIELDISKDTQARFVRCSCGAQGPRVSPAGMTLHLFQADLQAVEKWNTRSSGVAESIYEALQTILPSFTVSGGFPCQVEKRNPGVTVLNFPNFDFELKLFRDGTWEVERNGRLKEGQEGDVEISGSPTEKTR